ncbi:MAG TPA: hypothetical protein VE954_21655 [Oligoflexus sp.]|uniref:hypothetical protein n=1 Tax=Oligoflexus sp. TaxID=1971216 RepID=UPI002D67D8D7|nr:hypothetical protein [Oligoflexus sp.]HYX35711.1 hypothetical protein [Oligoflexus sp.]
MHQQLGIFSLSGNDRLPGPAYDKEHPDGLYQPVSCDFTDELESAVVLKTRLSLTFYGPHGLTTMDGVIISDLKSEANGEWLILPDQQRVRLDFIHEIRIHRSL